MYYSPASWRAFRLTPWSRVHHQLSSPQNLLWLDLLQIVLNNSLVLLTSGWANKEMLYNVQSKSRKDDDSSSSEEDDQEESEEGEDEENVDDVTTGRKGRRRARRFKEKT